MFLNLSHNFRSEVTFESMSIKLRTHQRKLGSELKLDGEQITVFVTSWIKQDLDKLVPTTVFQ